MLHFVSEYDPSTTGFEAGFKIDLNESLIHHPNSTYLMRMDSSELVGSHILQGDMLVVDRSVPPLHGSLVVVHLNGQRLVRIYEKQQNKIALYNSLLTGKHPTYLKPHDIFEVFGTVIHILRTYNLNHPSV